MNIEEFKVDWQKQTVVTYSAEEISDIYEIRKKRVFSSIIRGFTQDLLISLIIVAVFIAALQIMNLHTSNFWSICLALLGLQHLVFHQLQVTLIEKLSSYEQDVLQSLIKATTQLKKLLWFYRIWPTMLAVLLFLVYVIAFKPELPIWQLIVAGATLVAVVATLANMISAVMVRKHYNKLNRLLTGLTQELA